jgi:protocatechuate 3,4-dioxygenase beta subunit
LIFHLNAKGETMKRFFTLLLLMIFTACSNTANTVVPTLTQDTPPTAMVTVPAPTEISATETLSPTAEPEGDLFSQLGITLPAPACNSGLTPLDMEGPYYRPDTPERISLLEQGMEGERLVLVGYVLDQNCQPVPNAWLDFWQADANGEYDNNGYRLRGHQFTDSQGRYFLETIVPGEYGSRPIEHIHVKVQLLNQDVITSQLYFPGQSVPNQTVTIEEREGYRVGYYNFVLQN